MCSLLFVHKLAFVCDSVVFKACCYGVKQFKKPLLTDRPPAGERRPSDRQRGGGKQGGGGDKGTDERRPLSKVMRSWRMQGKRDKEEESANLKTDHHSSFSLYMVQCQCYAMIVGGCNVTNGTT